MCFRISRYKYIRASCKTQPAPGQSRIESALEDFRSWAQVQRNISKSLRITVNFYSPAVHVEHSRSIWRHLQHTTSKPWVIFVTPVKSCKIHIVCFYQWNLCTLQGPNVQGLQVQKTAKGRDLGQSEGEEAGPRAAPKSFEASAHKEVSPHHSIQPCRNPSLFRLGHGAGALEKRLLQGRPWRVPKSTH